MKRFLYKASISLPLCMILYCFLDSFAFSIPEVGLFWGSSISKFFIVMVTVLWLCCSPLRKSCCNGSLTELLFNIVPVEIVLLFVFAQWHFAIAVVTVLLLIAAEIVIFKKLRKDECKQRVTTKRHRKYQTAFHRLSVMSVAVISLIPCCLALFIYGFQSPTYKAEQELWEQIYGKPDIVSSNEGKSENIYAENKELWNCFSEQKWDHFSVAEKITVMQKLVDFESDVLGIPTISVTAGMIGDVTLGAYDNETNEMWINTEHLANSSAEDSIRTICHETYHSMQYYLIKSIDMTTPALQTAYFKELQDWADNQENYKQAGVYGFDAYENQPLEVAAREYSTQESLRIMEYVSSVENQD